MGECSLGSARQMSWVHVIRIALMMSSRLDGCISRCNSSCVGFDLFEEFEFFSRYSLCGMALVWMYRHWNSVMLLLAAVAGFGRGCSRGCAGMLRRWLSRGV